MRRLRHSVTRFVLKVPVITESDALVQGTMLGSKEGVVMAVIISLWPRGVKSPLRRGPMTLAVESNASMNGGHQASLSTKPSFRTCFMFPSLGSSWSNLQGCVLSREVGNPKSSPWVAVSGPGFMMEGKEGNT